MTLRMTTNQISQIILGVLLHFQFYSPTDLSVTHPLEHLAIDAEDLVTCTARSQGRGQECW